MSAVDRDAEERERAEVENLSHRGMYVLTGGLTQEGDTFLIAVAAVFLMVLLYPLIGGWAFVSFPIVLLAAVLARKYRGRRRA